MLSCKIDNHLFNTLYEQSSATNRARLLSVSSPHAASWVSVIPGLGLHLQPSEFQVAIKWWLGLDTSCGSICPLCPGKVLDPLGHHALTCKRGGDVVTRHNKLRDTLAETCRRAHLSVKVEAGSNLSKDHSHTCPADILVPNWSLGKPAAFDLSVMSPLNSNILKRDSEQVRLPELPRKGSMKKMMPNARNKGGFASPWWLRHMVLGGQKQWSLFLFWLLALQLAPTGLRLRS